jgi:hypothetical protein
MRTGRYDEFNQMGKRKEKKRPEAFVSRIIILPEQTRMFKK